MKIAPASTDAEKLACFAVLSELRPSLKREHFLDDLARMSTQGYGLVALWDPEVRAVAGVRPMEMFSTGPILYVDDLVAAAAHRSRGYGHQLLAFLEGYAQSLGCRFLELDSGDARLDAHRFYRREGMASMALHFSKPLGGRAAWTQDA